MNEKQISFENEEVSIEVKWDERLEIVQKWFREGRSLILPNNQYGVIEREPESFSGAWGYEGDSIAVYVSGRPYKSEELIGLNL